MMLVTIKTYDNKTYSQEVESFDLDGFIQNRNTAPHEMMKFGNIGIIKSAINTVLVGEDAHEFDGQEG